MRKKIIFISKIILLIMSSFWLVFSILSGSSEGLIQNIPNAIPWAILFISSIIVWKNELVGGIIILALGISTIFFFNAFKELFALFAFTIPLIVLGVIFISRKIDFKHLLHK